MAIREIGSILLSSKAINQEQLEFVLMIQAASKTNERIGRILRYYNFVSDEEIAKALAQQVGWRYFDKKYVVNLPAIEKIGLDFLRDRVFIPVETAKGLAFVFAYPFDIEATDILAKKEDNREFYIGSEEEIRYHLERLDNEKKIKEINENISRIKAEGFQGDELKELAGYLLDNAVVEAATDIHIEPGEKTSTVRFRIDGILYFKFSIPKEVHNNLINVIFNKADITVSDFFKFHDARFQHVYTNHPVDVRVSCIPSIFGPALVLRLLDVNKTLISLEKLGFNQAHFDAIKRVVQKPHGIIIITGPTGSGKTTSLYAILNQLKSISAKVITIEDPVEIKMPLVNQVQINEKQGITFAHATRAFLRHDPDIILIGEIRDSETAKEAIRASITGHKVLSTLHTNSCVGSLYRLHDLGIEPSHIANSILCVVSQRLIRKLCPFCRKRISVKKEKLLEFFDSGLNANESEITLYKASGCKNCRAGYRGRTVIAEVLCFDEEMRDMVSQGKFDSLRQKKAQEGFISLKQDAIRLVRQGVTSLEEAIRVAG